MRKIEEASEMLPVCMGLPTNYRALGKLPDLVEASMIAPDLGSLPELLDFKHTRFFRAPSPLEDAYTVMISAPVHGSTSWATLAVCLPLSMCVRQGAFTLSDMASALSFECDLSHVSLPGCTMVFDYGVLAERVDTDNVVSSWLIRIDHWCLRARLLVAAEDRHEPPSH